MGNPQTTRPEPTHQDLIQRELEAMQAAYKQLLPLGQESQRRALSWLAEHFGYTLDTRPRY